MARCGASIGAKVARAQGCHTRRNFAHTMGIAQGLALETRYWLELIIEAKILRETRLHGLLGEVDELIKILTTIVKHAREES